MFIDGCFWHGCPEHQHIPKTNREYWVPKLQANVERDRRVDRALVDAGWEVIRVWEHVDVEDAADEIVATVESQRSRR